MFTIAEQCAVRSTVAGTYSDSEAGLRAFSQPLGDFRHIRHLLSQRLHLRVVVKLRVGANHRHPVAD